MTQASNLSQLANKVNSSGQLDGSTGLTSPVSDSLGDLRSLPNNNRGAAYVPVAADNGQVINITTGGVTVNSGVFSVGNNFIIFNNSAVSQTITQGAGVTMYAAGSSATGNRTLSQRGLATVLCVAANTFVISGAGLS